MASENFLSKANTKFALDLFKKFSEDNTGNIFYSPFSISVALSMVKLGAMGNTATQMSEVLYFVERAAAEEEAVEESESSQISLSKDPPYSMLCQMQTRRKIMCQKQTTSLLPLYLKKCLKPQYDEGNVDVSFSQLLSEFRKPDALYTLSLANRLYGEQTYTFLPHFISETMKYYNAPLETVDFTSNPDGSRVKINKWVEKETQEKITDLLSPEAIGSSTKLVLVNAIYFKGKWEAQFEEKFTQDAEFRVNKTDTKPVKMMNQRSEFKFSFFEEAKIKVLEMPYKGKDLSMIILLPNDIEDDTTGLEKLEGELTYDKFKEWTNNDKLLETTVEVSLPIFKMEESYDMKDVLISMGMEDAFDVSKSDFSGMSEANDLALSKVVHKAYVSVDEEGTEAAAATAVVLIERAAFIVEKFIVDHPFLFFIRHNPSESILFAGRVCSPE